MSAGPAASLLRYVWHYLVARMLYDHLLRPIGQGDTAGIVLLICVAGVAFAIGRRTGRSA